MGLLSPIRSVRGSPGAEVSIVTLALGGSRPYGFRSSPFPRRLSILANSSESVARYGVLPERVDAYRDLLDSETSELISDLVGDRYERVTVAVAR